MTGWKGRAVALAEAIAHPGSRWWDYGCALLARRLGVSHVTSIDVDPYLAVTAAARLATFGLEPQILPLDATSPLPGSYDRIVPMVSLRGVPASWLEALRPGGRLVFSVAGCGVLITADKTADGGAVGKVELDCAWFMADRHGEDYPRRPVMDLAAMTEMGGEHVGRGRYPVLDIGWSSDVDAMLAITAPGTEYGYERDDETGIGTTWLRHGDGSWARASGRADEAPVVHQGGPRRLWDVLDGIQHHWITRGELPLRGADVAIEPDGTCHLANGDWHAAIGPADPGPAGSS